MHTEARPPATDGTARQSPARRGVARQIFANPEAIAREFDLAAAEAEAIKQLDREKFEATVARLRWG